MPHLSQHATAALAHRYTIERKLGGGMAAVFLACDLRDERQVALKVLELRRLGLR